MEERRNLIHWIKKHRKQLIIAGISIGALILLIIGINNKDTIQAVWNSLIEALKHPTSETTEDVSQVITKASPIPVPEMSHDVTYITKVVPFEVSSHIRNLPEGFHASPEKIAEALALNITLIEGQTLVDSYMKGGVAA